MQLPDFLIIGAQKCGTTGLYQDLRSHPRIFMPEDKEPSNLATEHVLTERGRRDYAALFTGASVDQICGEASTAYTKIPNVGGVPERARQVLDADLKLFYIIRNPVERIVSHHFHEYSAGRIKDGLDVAVRTDNRLLDYSRYAMQARAWIEVFGRDSLHVLRFEDYVNDRRRTVARVQEILGLGPRPDLIDTDKVHNQSKGKPVSVGFFNRVARSGLYRSSLRRWLSSSQRQRFRRVLLPAALGTPERPTSGTVDFIIEKLTPELHEQAVLLGRNEPLWSNDELRAVAISARVE